MCGRVSVVCLKGVRTCVCGRVRVVCGGVRMYLCVTSFLVQFAAEMSHPLAAPIEMAHLIGCTLCS